MMTGCRIKKASAFSVLRPRRVDAQITDLRPGAHLSTARKRREPGVTLQYAEEIEHQR